MRSSRSIHTRLLQLIGAQALILTTSLAWADSAPNHVHDVKVHATDTVSGAAEIEVVGTASSVAGDEVSSSGWRWVNAVLDATLARHGRKVPALDTIEFVTAR